MVGYVEGEVGTDMGNGPPFLIERLAKCYSEEDQRGDLA